MFVNIKLDFKYNLNDIDNEICILLSKANLSKYPSVMGPIPDNMKDPNFDEKLENEVIHKLPLEMQEEINKLNCMERRKYLFFKKDIIIPWFFVLDLKENKFKDRVYDLYDWDPITKQLPITMDLINKMPFDEIGRVVIYGSWPGAKVPCHKDSSIDAIVADQINFNPGGYRPLYIYDDKNNVKHYLPNDYNFYFFDTSKYHGVDSLPYFSYTVRIDGQFSKSVKK